MARGWWISVGVEITLTNSGPVETTVKDAFIEVYRSKKDYNSVVIACRLDEQTGYTMEVAPGPRELRGSAIGPRSMWGPAKVVFGGRWEVDTLPEIWYAVLIIEPIGQGRLEQRYEVTYE